MTAAMQESFPLVNPRYEPLVYSAAAATSVAAFSLLAPWECIRIIATTIITGLGYGIANHLVGCHDCIEYFTVGHFYDGKSLEYRPLHTLNPVLNAVAWGAVDTWHVCAVAGAFFSFMARLYIPGLALKITAIQLAPYLALGAGLALLISHLNSRYAQKQMEEHPYEKYPGVPLDLQAGWEACEVRNLTGYKSIGIGGAVFSVAILAARAGLFIL